MIYKYLILETRRAERDAAKCIAAGLEPEYNDVVKTLEEEPFRRTQQFERLKGNLKDFCSRRVDHSNRLVYTVFPNTIGKRDEHGNLYRGIVLICSAWGHRYKLPKSKNLPF